MKSLIVRCPFCRAEIVRIESEENYAYAHSVLLLHLYACPKGNPDFSDAALHRLADEIVDKATKQNESGEE